MSSKTSRADVDGPGGQRLQLLAVAFHFPPQSGSSGVLRTLNFVRHLPTHGWQSTVLTAHPRAYAECSNALLDQIPKDARVVRAFALDASRHMAWRGRYPGVLATPDKWSSWFLGGLFQGLRIIRSDRPSVIWSTYPVATAHCIGAMLSKLTGLPWAVDFRDPMLAASQAGVTRMQRWGLRMVERWVAKRASLCIFTTARAAEDFARRHPALDGRCHVIENGFDEAAFSGLKPVRPDVSPDTMLMLHSGLIYPVDRDPLKFFLAVRGLMDRGVLDRERVRVRFRAPQHGAAVMHRAAEAGIQDVVEIAQSLPYREALGEMMGADLLLLFQGAAFNAQIPAKVYEYLRAGGQMLAMTDLAGDTAALLRTFEQVGLADIASEDAIEYALSQWLFQRQSAAAAATVQINRDRVMKFTRAAQAARLDALLRELISPAIGAK